MRNFVDGFDGLLAYSVKKDRIMILGFVLRVVAVSHLPTPCS